MYCYLAMYVCTYMHICTVDIIIISFEFCSEATYSIAVCTKMAATCKILGLCTLMLCYFSSTVISVKEQEKCERNEGVKCIMYSHTHLYKWSN